MVVMRWPINSKRLLCYSDLGKWKKGELLYNAESNTAKHFTQAGCLVDPFFWQEKWDISFFLCYSKKAILSCCKPTDASEWFSTQALLHFAPVAKTRLLCLPWLMSYTISLFSEEYPCNSQPALFQMSSLSTLFYSSLHDIINLKVFQKYVYNKKRNIWW